MKKIALEEHFNTPEFMQRTEEDFAAMDPKDVVVFKRKLLDIDEIRINEMDKAGIEISVLSLTDPGVQGKMDAAEALVLAPQVNDYLAEKIAKHPTRFRGFAHLPMQDPGAAAKELERCVQSHHFVGALINGQTNGLYLDDAKYFPFWEKVQELDVPIYLHPGNPVKSPISFTDHPELQGALWGWGVETGTHALRIILNGVFDRYPRVKLILGHMGETLPYLLWRFDSRWQILKKNNPLNKMPSEYLKENIYVTTSGMSDNPPFLCALQALGDDHILFSVDYPYESSEVAAKFLEQAPISEAQKNKVAYYNAKRILKL